MKVRLTGTLGRQEREQKQRRHSEKTSVKQGSICMRRLRLRHICLTQLSERGSGKIGKALALPSCIKHSWPHLPVEWVASLATAKVPVTWFILRAEGPACAWMHSITQTIKILSFTARWVNFSCKDTLSMHYTWRQNVTTYAEVKWSHKQRFHYCGEHQSSVIAGEWKRSYITWKDDTVNTTWLLKTGCIVKFSNSIVRWLSQLFNWVVTVLWTVSNTHVHMTTEP